MADKLAPLAVSPAECARLLGISRPKIKAAFLPSSWAPVHSSVWTDCGNGFPDRHK